MLRPLTISTGVLLALTLLLTGQSFSEAEQSPAGKPSKPQATAPQENIAVRAKPAPPQQPSPEEKIRKALSKRISVDFDDTPFDQYLTALAPFDTGKETIKVPMMHHSDELWSYAQLDELQILEMPYAEHHLSMMILLPPKGKKNLANLERALTSEKLAEWSTHLRSQKVRVYLPKFKFDSEFRLIKVLKSLGMREAFSSAADFSGIFGRHVPPMSFVLHKTFIEVNERGTEAVADTVMGFFGEKPPVFRADHPFLFLIRDNRTGSILFIGRLVNPT